MYKLIITFLLFTVLSETPAFAQVNQTDIQSEVMCTMDVQQCPDGTFVGRSGPNCEFVCPDSGPTTEPPVVIDPALETPDDMTNDQSRAEARENAQLERQNQLQANQAAREASRAERQTALSEVRQQRIINLAANLSNRIEAVLERLYAIVTRLENRIEKLTESGVNTNEARTALQTAAQTLAEIKGMMADIDTRVVAATTSETPLTAWNELRKHYQTVASLVRQAHAELRATIAELKIALSETTGNASDAARSEGSLTDE